MHPEKLAEARRLAAMASDPVKVIPGHAGAVCHMLDGATWGPLNGHPCRLIVPPRTLGGRWLVKRDYDALTRRQAELRAERDAVREAA